MKQVVGSLALILFVVMLVVPVLAAGPPPPGSECAPSSTPGCSANDPGPDDNQKPSGNPATDWPGDDNNGAGNDPPHQNK